MELRSACAGDVPAMLDIYAQYIDTPVTFESVLPAREDFAARLIRVQAVHPWICADADGRLAGYAYAHCPWERAAYQWNAEISVYLDQSARGRGLGTRLCRALLDLLRLQHVRVALSCVTVPNAASEALHASLGFTRCARFARSGWKAGTWHDVIWLTLPLADDDEPPLALLPAPAVDPAAAAAVLRAHSSPGG